MDVIWQILNVNLKLAIRASGNVLQTVHHMEVYVLSVDLFSTIRSHHSNDSKLTSYRIAP